MSISAPINVRQASKNKASAEKVKSFLHDLAQTHPFQAATSLLEAIKSLQQQSDVMLRIETLELYQKFTSELSNALEKTYGEAPQPLQDAPKHYAELAKSLWLETSRAYQQALVDLKQKLIKIKIRQQQALILLRAIEALNHANHVDYLTYSSPSESQWENLHKLYFHALQHALENIEIKDKNKTVQQTITHAYSQSMLMHIANPQKLNKHNILKLKQYVVSLSTHVKLNAIGYIEKPLGVFLIELDSKKGPVPYLQNKNTPSVETDILLLTVEVARHIHQQLKYIQEANEHQVPLPNATLEIEDEPLLRHLIQYFGTSNGRQFSRVEKQQSARLAIGLDAASLFFSHQNKANHFFGAKWDIINTSPTGYAFKTARTLKLSVAIGDLVTIEEEGATTRTLGHVVWLTENQQHIEIGVKLLSPTAQLTPFRSEAKQQFENALLLPAMQLIKAPATLITRSGRLQSGDVIDIKLDNQQTQLEIDALIERSPSFDRFQFSLIDNDLS